MTRSIRILTLVCLGSFLALAAYAGDRAEAGMPGHAGKHPTWTVQSSPCGQAGMSMKCGMACKSSSMCGAGASSGIWYRGGPKGTLAGWMEKSCARSGHRWGRAGMMHRGMRDMRCGPMGMGSGCQMGMMKGGCAQMSGKQGCACPGCRMGQGMMPGPGMSSKTPPPWSNHAAPGMSRGAAKCPMGGAAGSAMKPGCCSKGAKGAKNAPAMTPPCGGHE
jgi:hypothetical protein